jgi:hypothetical protein
MKLRILRFVVVLGLLTGHALANDRLTEVFPADGIPLGIIRPFSYRLPLSPAIASAVATPPTATAPTRELDQPAQQMPAY